MKILVPLDVPNVTITTYETKDGRTPVAICAIIGGKQIPITFDYRTIRYVKRLLLEFSENGAIE